VKKIISLIFTIIILVLIVVYGALVSFSESREYGRVSLDYYLLTPNELSQLSGYCENDPRFIYSSADGPKPTIIQLHCLFERNVMDEYLIKNKFDQASRNHFKRGDIEIEFEENDSNKVTVTTVYEYL
jgi:hypothetical protein